MTRAGILKEAFEYDAFGDRTKKRTFGTGTNLLSTWFLGDGFEIQKNNADSPAKYSATWKIDGVAVITSGDLIANQSSQQIVESYVGNKFSGNMRSGTAQGPYVLLTDGLGSTISVTRPGPVGVPDGAQMTRYFYDAWGALKEDNSSGRDITSAKFTGQSLEDDSGLHYYGSRYYDPRSKRFLTPDSVLVPAGAQGFNRFSYVLNNPVRYIDPDGHFPVGGLGGLLGAIGGTGGDDWGPEPGGPKLGGFGLGSSSGFGNSGRLGGFGVGFGAMPGGPRLGGDYGLKPGGPRLGGSFGSKPRARRVASTQTASPGRDIGWWKEVPGSGGSVSEWAARIAGHSSIYVPNAADLEVRGEPVTGGVGLAGTVVITGSIRAQIGKIGERWLAKNVGGIPHKFFMTKLGPRIVDAFANMIAHESKVGFKTLTWKTSRQIKKEVLLMRNLDIQGSVWHFFASPWTGLKGPSQPLRAALTKAGIQIVIH